MKKLFVFLSLLPSFILAIPFGNPGEPCSLKEGIFFKDKSLALSISYEKDFVLSKKMNAKGTNFDDSLDSYQMYADLGGVILNIKNWADLYAYLGGSQVNFSFSPSTDHKIREFQTSDHLTWMCGGKTLLYKKHQWAISIDGKLEKAYSQVKWNTLNGANLPTQAKYHYIDWQLGAGVSYKIDIFTPYLALTGSSSKAHIKKMSDNLELNTTAFSLKTTQPIGLSIGCGLSKGKYFDLNLEVSLINQSAISLFSKFQF